MTLLVKSQWSIVADTFCEVFTKDTIDLQLIHTFLAIYTWV